MHLALRIDDLWKEYRLGVFGHGMLFRDLQSWWAGIRGKEDPNRRISETSGAVVGSDRIWALKGVDLAIRQGEVLGIIGRNGAGKSTMLKLISRVTAPTRGEIRIQGRVASLLEVGTGFHPELTGCENVFLNGAILGMGVKEIARKLDEIIEFSGVGKFIDTPVKRYSSGMFVRLAFAVAAHLEPDILVVDEVLAVGDAEFQKKCLGKMKDQSRSGRTILFVSHNLTSVRQLCTRCVWIHDGTVQMDGETASVVQGYLEFTGVVANPKVTAEWPSDTSKPSQLRRARIVGETVGAETVFSCDSPVIIELVYEVRTVLKGLRGTLQLTRSDGTEVLQSHSHDLKDNPWENLPAGLYTVRVTIPPRTLGHGHYRIHFTSSSPAWPPLYVDDLYSFLGFTLEDPSTEIGNRRAGCLSTLLKWETSAT